MIKTFSMTIYIKSIPINIKVTINVIPDFHGESAEYEIERIASRTTEYRLKELEIEDQEEVKNEAQQWADDLAYEATLERLETDSDIAYDNWMDSHHD